MATDFALFLRRFLTAHLAGLRGCSPNTVASYRDTFKLLIVFFRDDRSIPPEKLTLDCIDATTIAGFLDWLEASRHNSVSTGTPPEKRTPDLPGWSWLKGVPPWGNIAGSSRRSSNVTRLSWSVRRVGRLGR